MNLRIPLFAINLRHSVERRQAISKSLSNEPLFEYELVDAVYGADLPLVARAIVADDDVWAKCAGEIGCFLSHLKVWERVAQCDTNFAVVAEDDMSPIGLGRFTRMRLPDDAELIFLNKDMSLHPEDFATEHVPTVVPVMTLLPGFLNGLQLSRRNVGAYAYAIRPAAARKLVAQIRKDAAFGNVDWRMLRYAVKSEEIRTAFANTELDIVLHRHHNQSRPPAWGILTAYGVDRPLAVSSNGPSTIR